MARVSNTKIMNEIKNFKNSQDVQISALEGLSKSLSNSKATTDMFNDNLTSINKLMETMIDARRQDEVERAERDRRDKIKEDSAKMSDAMKRLTSRFVDLAKTVADTANRYSQISNELITVTGASGRDVRDTRSEIVQDIVKQINKETGNFLNPEKSYQKVVDIANQANIGNLEAIEEITRPMIIASETMNIKNDELASLFNKWYTRYNFSSMQMEDMVDEIRGNTAGNNATAAATMENISKFQNFIGAYANGPEVIEAIAKAISQDTSRLESVGIKSGVIYDYMYQIATGNMDNAVSIMSLLNNSGTGIDWTEANSLLRSGNPESIKLISDALVKGYESISDRVLDSSVAAESAKVFGLDIEDLMNIKGASNILLSDEEFMKSVSGTQSAVESMEDKFNTVSDKLKNILSGFSEHFANIQERLGVGITDIIQTLLLINASIQLGNLLNGGGSGGTGGAARGLIRYTSSGIRNSLAGYAGGQMINANILGQTLGASGGTATSVGLAAGAAGIAGGALMGFDGIKGAIDDTQSTTSRVFSGVEAGLGIGGAGALIGLGLSNPIGWAALGLGGVAFLIKKSTELTGNAEKVADDIVTIGDSIKKENDLRLDQLDTLTREFYSTNDVVKQRELLEKSGLFQTEDFNNKSSEAMQEMLRSYRSAASEMDEITDQITKTAKKYYTGQSKDAQKDFIEDLKGSKLSDDQWSEVFSLINQDESIDNKTSDKINKMLEDGVTVNEKRKILGLLSKSQISGDTYDAVTNYMIANDQSDWIGKSYDVYQNYDYIMRALAFLKDESTNEKAFGEKIKEIREKGLEDELVNANGGISIKTLAQSRGFKGYRTGSNYIESDQYATIHEGEAVVPKKYNPSANVTELEMLRSYYKNSTNKENAESISSMKEIASVLSEIRDFLSYWKDDNNHREDINNRKNSLLSNSNYIAHYMSTY